jgi:ActR/RegA family two-component response regulator
MCAPAEHCPCVLFVDDEPNIRLTLPCILKHHGFEVTTAASVAEALVAINSSRFDVLLSDLNIGEKGDGFVVVTAMRHAQPDCLAVILTGYPAFETALEAIRHHVDDYLVKPADIGVLVASLRDKLAARADSRSQRKKITTLLREYLPTLISRLPQALQAEGARPCALDEGAYLARLPRILECLLRTLENGDDLGPEALALSAEHGMERRKQGYGAAAIINDVERLHMQILDLVESRLMDTDTGSLIAELRRIERALYQFAKCSIAAQDGSEERISA